MFGKKKKKPITEEIRKTREHIREVDSLLEDLEKYFKKIEKKLDMSYLME